jgi:hypothetical protein
MRAISLWQPWASAIALRLKSNETRGWATTYRGPLAIHAALRFDGQQRAFAETERALVATVDSDEPVWPGYHDADGWHFADAMPAHVSHWKPMPAGPNG